MSDWNWAMSRGCHELLSACSCLSLIPAICEAVASDKQLADKDRLTWTVQRSGRRKLSLAASELLDDGRTSLLHLSHHTSDANIDRVSFEQSQDFGDDGQVVRVLHLPNDE